MFKGIHHVGVVVEEIERSIKFYTEVSGAKLLYRAGAQPKDVEKEVDVLGATTKLAVLKLGSHTIELVEYVKPKIHPKGINAAAIGTLHLALEVDNIDKEVDRMKRLGVKFNAPPKVIEEGENKGWVWTYFKDPDGSQLELVENRNLRVQL